MNISKLILGTVQLGLPYGINNTTGKPDLQESLAILETAQRSGIEALDTADAYGDSQRVIAEFHKNHRPFKILSKFKFSDSNRDLESCLKKTLSQLGCSFLDTYSFHSFQDYLTFQDKSLLKELQREGKVEKWGVSIYSNEEFEQAIEFDAIDVIQTPFNLLDNMNKRGALIKKAKQRGKTVHVRSVFLQGLFFKTPENFPAQLQPLMPEIQLLNDLAKAHSLSMQEMALQYALSIPEIDGVLFGIETVEQLKQNLISLQKSRWSTELTSAIHEINCSHVELLNPANWKS
jgi:aryl-alcohol dehydrogenase-like predicted oxidoreductase